MHTDYDERWFHFLRYLAGELNFNYSYGGTTAASVGFQNTSEILAESTFVHYSI